MSDATAPSGKDFVTKDSGQRHEFETGSVRDTEAGKADWTLLPLTALRRVVALYMRGAVKYERHNWRKGQSLARAERSLWRHLAQYMDGDRDEDHMAAVVFNACVILDHEERIANGELPASLDDRDEWRRTAHSLGSLPGAIEALTHPDDAAEPEYFFIGDRVRIVGDPAWLQFDPAHGIGIEDEISEVERDNDDRFRYRLLATAYWYFQESLELIKTSSQFHDVAGATV